MTTFKKPTKHLPVQFNESFGELKMACGPVFDSEEQNARIEFNHLDDVTCQKCLGRLGSASSEQMKRWASNLDDAGYSMMSAELLRRAY